jgi:hypothetical protein
MSNLKLIADEVSDALNRPFDDMFKERIKSLFRHQLATMIRQQLNKTGVDDQFKTKYSVVCKPIFASDSPFVTGTLTGKWFRTINTVSKPIRYTTDDPFIYVGSVSGYQPYIYTKLAEIPYVSYMYGTQQTYQVVSPATIVYPNRYVYSNDYIYVYYDEGVITLDELGDPVPQANINILIEGVHLGFNNIATSTNDDYTIGTIFDDESEFPMPDDIIQLTKEMLYKGELSIIDSNDKIKSEHIDNN